MKTSIIWPLSLDFLAQSVLTVQFSLATYGRRGVLTAPPMSSTIPTPELPPLPPNALLRCHHSPPLQPHGVFSPSSPKSHPVLKLSSPDLNAFREALPDHSDCLIIYVSSTSLILHDICSPVLLCYVIDESHISPVRRQVLWGGESHILLP